MMKRNPAVRAIPTTAYPPGDEDHPDADREDRREDSPRGVADEGHRVMGVVHRAAHVRGPTTPSTPRRFSRWNARMTASVAGP